MVLKIEAIKWNCVNVVLMGPVPFFSRLLGVFPTFGAFHPVPESASFTPVLFWRCIIRCSFFFLFVVVDLHLIFHSGLLFWELFFTLPLQQVDSFRFFLIAKHPDERASTTTTGVFKRIFIYLFSPGVLYLYSLLSV